MKLTLKIKLLPTEQQFLDLVKTIELANYGCNKISLIAWEKSVFNQFKLHKESYYQIKSETNLSSQMVVRCISKVCDSYKIDRKCQRVFKKHGSVSYDSRILTYLDSDIVSIWSKAGRLKIPFKCHNRKYLPYIKGEADLVFKNDKLYLFQTVEIPDSEIDNIEDFIGVDFGLTDIAVTSDGIKHSAEWINSYRAERQKVRSSLQSKGTKGAKKLLKRLSGRERITSTIINHTISKSIVLSAKESNRGIAIEDLTNILKTGMKKRKNIRTKLGNWSFHQLRSFLSYKSKISGVKLVIVEPAFTSKTCSSCHHIGKRTNKDFKCLNCGHNDDADINASKNIATLGAIVNKPEKSDSYSCSIRYSDLNFRNESLQTIYYYER